MAERKATNKYYPPEWDPSKGSINKFRGQHPLRERAKKIKEGILKIRFEMPYNVWCEGCNTHIGKGVRYNAEKKQVGKYHSTKIWEFRMKCHLCPNIIVVQTNPQTSDYDFISGAKRKTEDWDVEDSGTMSLADIGEKAEKMDDPFYRLEHLTEDQKKAEGEAPQLIKLVEVQKLKKDDFSLSQAMRKTLREHKKKVKDEKEANEKRGILIDLLPPSEEDARIAKEIFVSATNPLGIKHTPNSISKTSATLNERSKKHAIKTSSIFGTQSKPAKDSKMKFIAKLFQKNSKK